MLDTQVDLNHTAYQVLGVSETATQEEVAKAHRTLMRKFHPDLNPNADQDKAKAINDAFDKVKNSAARSSYDFALRDARKPAYEPAAEPAAEPTNTTESHTASAFTAPTFTSEPEDFVAAGDHFDYADAGIGKRAGTSRLILRLVTLTVMLAGIWTITVASTSVGPGLVWTWVFAGASLLSLFRPRFLLGVVAIFGAIIWPLSLTGLGIFTWFTHLTGPMPFAAVTAIGAAVAVWVLSRKPATV